MNAKDFELLERAEHLAKCIDAMGVFTGRTMRKRTAERCVARGWMVNAYLTVCDGDGFSLDPERWRWGYSLTEAGREALHAEQRCRAERNGR